MIWGINDSDINIKNRYSMRFFVRVKYKRGSLEIP